MFDKLFAAALAKPKDERGATATEYAVLVAFIVLAIVLGVGAFGGALDGLYAGFAPVVDGW